LFTHKADLEKEIEREFPKVKRPIEEFHRNVMRISEELDALLERDLTWPPVTFWERREFARASARQQFDREGRIHDLLAEFPEDHPFRLAVHYPAYFGDGIDPDQVTELRLSRLYANWYKGALAINEGQEALYQLLIDKIRSHSGAIQLNARADEILIQHGAVRGVRLEALDDEIGCNHIVAGIDLADLLELLPERSEFEELFERIGEPQRSHYRYILNLVVSAGGFPVGMKRDVFYLRSANKPRAAEDLIHIQSVPIDGDSYRLSVEALLPRRQIEDVEGYVDTIRERLLEALRELLPFLDDYLLLIDSPNDGRPPQHCHDGVLPIPGNNWQRGPQTMPFIYAYPVTSALGLCAMPIHTPVRNLMLCNSQIVPGLGMEGLILAAWIAARQITRSDPSKERMCRGLWTKVEI